MAEGESGSMGGLGAAAQEMLSALRQMQTMVDGIVRSSAKMADNFRRANEAARIQSSGPDANTGGAGGVGAARKTSMDGSLGKITAPKEPGTFGSAFMANAGLSGAQKWLHEFGTSGYGAAGMLAVGAGKMAGNAARGIVNQSAAAAEGMYMQGRTSAAEAAEFERARMRAGIVGQDFDTLRANLTTNGLTPTDTIMAIDRFSQAGYLSRMGQQAGMANLSSMVAMGNLAGVDAGSAVQAASGMYTPQSAYAAQAAGISLVGPGNTPRSMAEVLNQVVNRFGLQGMSEEELARELTPGLGNLHYNLQDMGFSPELMDMMRNILPDVAAKGGKITDKDIENFSGARLPAGELARQDYTEARLTQTEASSKTVDEAYARETERLAGFHEAIGEAEGAFGTVVEKVNQFGAAFDTLTEKGVPGFFAALEAGAQALGVRLPGPDYQGRGSAEGDMNVATDKITKLHQGEMVLPARIANAVRSELGVGTATEFRDGASTSFAGAISGAAKGAAPEVNINVYVQQASEMEARRLAEMVQRYLKNGSELSGIGMGQVLL